MKREEVLKENCMDIVDGQERKNGDCSYFETIRSIKKDKLNGRTLRDKANGYILDDDYCTMFMTF